MNIRSPLVFSITFFVHTMIQCSTIVSYNYGFPQLSEACQDFPLLTTHMHASHIATIAHRESNKPWWKKIWRTPTYAACLEMESLLEDFHNARIRSNIMQQQTEKNGYVTHSSWEPDLASFTTKAVKKFVQEKIALIVGNDYQPDVRNDEYCRFMAIITHPHNSLESPIAH